MRSACGGFVAILLSCGALPALADDSTAALGAGGIVLTTATQLRMTSEDLAISPDAVHIHYVFANDSGKDIDTLVAFPLPDIDTWNFYESAMGETTSDPVNFVGFKATADGKPVPVKVEQRAIYRGRDVTAVLQSVGVPVNVIPDENFRKFDALPAAKKRLLEHAGIAEADSPDQEHPKWIVRTRFYWQQHFPAHGSVTIEHSYKPVTGQAFFSPIEANAVPGSADDYWKKRYCMDAGTVAKLKTMTGAAQKHVDKNSGMLEAYSTDFILKTANNWQGGIGKFHLVIDKLKPTKVLSLCWNGTLKKTGPTTFAFDAADFHPQQDLAFVVLE